MGDTGNAVRLRSSEPKSQICCVSFDFLLRQRSNRPQGVNADSKHPVKAAWPDAVAPSDMRSVRSQQGIRAWAEQLQLLRKREAMAALGRGPMRA